MELLKRISFNIQLLAVDKERRLELRGEEVRPTSSPVKKPGLGHNAFTIGLFCMLIQALVFFSSYNFALTLGQYKAAQNEYTSVQTESAKQSVTEIVWETPEAEEEVVDYSAQTEELPFVDHSNLYSENNEYVCWIYAPNTNINYPVCRAEDNEFYLTHTYKKTYNPSGCIFMDANCRLEDFNIFLYGHCMKDETMFGQLDQVGDYFYIYTIGRTLKCKVVSSYTTDPESPTFTYLYSTDAYRSYLQYILNQSDVNYNYPVSVKDHLFTLSTCTGTGVNKQRFVVHGIIEKVS